MTDIVMLLIISILGIISIYALMVARRAEKKNAVLVEELQNKTDHLEHELSAMMDGAFGMGDYLEDVKKALKDILDKQLLLEHNDSGNLPYNQAVRMVGQGASVEDLVSSCGLSRAEAKLVELLHKKSPPVITPHMSSQEPVTTEEEKKEATTSSAANHQQSQTTKIKPQQAVKQEKPRLILSSMKGAPWPSGEADDDVPTFEEIINRMEADALANRPVKSETSPPGDSFTSIEKAQKRRNE